MNKALSPRSRMALLQTRRLAVFLVLACMLSLSGCVSKTKVYTADKTMTYRGDLYNMSNVQRISPAVEGKLPNGETVNMKGMDRNEVEDLLDENSPVMVSMYVEMDDQKMVYLRSSVDRWSEFSKMSKSLDSAMGKINKFMANKKSTQLKLK